MSACHRGEKMGRGHRETPMSKLQEGRVTGPRVWVIELAEELLNAGETKMARSLSLTILSLRKGLTREQTARLQRIIDTPGRTGRHTKSFRFQVRCTHGANFFEYPIPDDRGGL
jgi:hypothetical protein